MWVLTKLLTKTIPHTFVRNGYYYFSRRVPSDLRDTIEVNGIAVRLSALDCTENDTRQGQAATKLAKQFQGAQLYVNSLEPRPTIGS